MCILHVKGLKERAIGQDRNTIPQRTKDHKYKKQDGQCREKQLIMEYSLPENAYFFTTCCSLFHALIMTRTFSVVVLTLE